MVIEIIFYIITADIIWSYMCANVYRQIFEAEGKEIKLSLYSFYILQYIGCQ